MIVQNLQERWYTWVKKKEHLQYIVEKSLSFNLINLK